ncbi:hypothetical protein ACFSX9_13840 [Flavobacterium ardleyense]|uniref:YD repeat-containing protein n=1 Tax=Flavobacterium ardleyense TaxID=2038737 RepID=A0ABW5ZC34_9FLAO
MKSKFVLLIIILLFQKSYSQEIELRHLEGLENWIEKSINDNHFIIGTPSRISYTNFDYDSQSENYKESLSIFLNFYRTGTYNIDSIGRTKDRSMLQYGNRKGIDTYYYQDKPNQQKELFIQRYWWNNQNDIPNEMELSFNLKEIYKNDLLLQRFGYENELNFIYDDKNNLTEIISKIYKNPHEYNEKGEILNLKNNSTIESNTLFTYKYNTKNIRIEKKEINSEYITWITKYIYDASSRLVKEIKLDYTEGVLIYINPKIYQYNLQGDVVVLNEYLKHTSQLPSGNDEENIKSFLLFIDENPDYYLREHNAYTYQYDENGNWISKTFYKKESGSGYDYKYKLTRQIEYR